MDTVSLNRLTALLAAVVIVTACEGPQQVAMPALKPHHSGLSMSPSHSTLRNEAPRKQPLVYATGGCNGVCVFSYASGKLVGSLSIAGGVGGDCSDSAGNVFITNEHKVLEYAHGASTPSAILSIPGGQDSLACAIDPLTENLAIVMADGNTNVAVFPNAQGSPIFYNSHLSSVACGYDDAGDLFVSGAGESNGISVLASGASDFSVLSVNGALGNPGQMQWDGKYITYEGLSHRHIKVSRLRISGSSATVAGITRFSGAMQNAQLSWIFNGRILIPYAIRGLNTSRVGLWAYPKGGAELRKMGSFFGSKNAIFRGVTVSVPA